MVLRPATCQQQASCRVISAEVKSPQPQYNQTNVRVAGVIEVVGGGGHYAEVRGGVLILHVDHCPTSPPKWRIPLRGLHLLQASPLGLAFTLSAPADSCPAVTFQTQNEWDYERWVKCLAVELMRQTPLERVRFLDILGITHSLRRARSAECVVTAVDLPMPNGASLQHQPLMHHRQQQHNQIKVNSGGDLLQLQSDKISNPNAISQHLNQTPSNDAPDLARPAHHNNHHGLVYRKRSQAQLPDVVRDLPPCSRRSRSRKKELRPTKTAVRTHSLEPATVDHTANPQVADLLHKCQRSDVYVPVKEKRMLFESLWKRREENPIIMKRTQSLHDLSPHSVNPVKDIARYFESKCTPKLLHDVGISLENMVDGDRRFPTDFRISSKLSSKFSSLYDPTAAR